MNRIFSFFSLFCFDRVFIFYCVVSVYKICWQWSTSFNKTMRKKKEDVYLKCLLIIKLEIPRVLKRNKLYLKDFLSTMTVLYTISNFLDSINIITWDSSLKAGKSHANKIQGSFFAWKLIIVYLLIHVF